MQTVDFFVALSTSERGLRSVEAMMVPSFKGITRERERQREREEKKKKQKE